MYIEYFAATILRRNGLPSPEWKPTVSDTRRGGNRSLGYSYTYERSSKIEDEWTVEFQPAPCTFELRGPRLKNVVWHLNMALLNARDREKSLVGYQPRTENLRE